MENTVIEFKLQEAQSKSRERKITLENVLAALAEIDKYCTKTLGIKRKNLEGTVIYYDENAQHFANCYNGVPESTQLTARYNKKGHIDLSSIYRAKCTKRTMSIVFSDSAKPDIIDKMSRKDW